MEEKLTHVRVTLNFVALIGLNTPGAASCTNMQKAIAYFSGYLLELGWYQFTSDYKLTLFSF